MTIARIFSTALLGLALAASVAALGRAPQAAPGAHFTVTDAVVAPRPPAITATVNEIGAGARFIQNGGFEPAIERLNFSPEADAANSVMLSQQSATRYDSMREGALDGAEIEVYRIVNREMRIVRTDRVAAGGHAATGWINQTPKGKFIPADKPEAVYLWQHWSRPNAEMWLTVRAIGGNGAESPLAVPIRVYSPAKFEKESAKPTAYVDFKPRRSGAAAPGAPRALSAVNDGKGGVLLRWSPPSGGAAVAGYVVLKSDTPPDRHRGFYLALEGKAATQDEWIRRGDMVFVKTKVLDFSRSRLIRDRIWNAHSARDYVPKTVSLWPDEDGNARAMLRRHDPGTPVIDPGETYLHLEIDAGGRASVGQFNHSTTEQDYYDVLKPGRYRMQVWIRSNRPSSATFLLRGPTADQVAPLTFATGPEWRLVDKEFSISRITTSKKAVGRMELIFKGAAAFDIDNFRIWPADSPYLGFSPTDRERLADAKIEVLRTHAFVRTGRMTYDLAQLTNAGGAISGVVGSNTLPQTLAAMESAGIDPWLQIEPHLSPKEWLGLVEYLAAPARDDLSWARKRAAQGRAAPWTDAFDKIYLELGNETWNRLFRPWVFSSMIDAATGEEVDRGTVYGLFQEHVIGILRSSPHWKAAGLDDKVEFVIGGWNHNVYGSKAAAASPSSDHMTVAAYNGGWDENEALPTGTPESFLSVLNHVSQATLPKAHRHAASVREISAGRGKPLAVGTYEAGPGYVLNGLNGARVSEEDAEKQEKVMKSQAAGVATLDNFLAHAVNGYKLQNFFILKEGLRFSSHAMWFRGGQAYPSWKMVGLLNREGRGDILDVRTLGTPTANLKKGRLRIAVDDAPLVGAYATRDGDRLNLFVISRRVPFYPDKDEDGCTPVTVDLPFTAARSLTVHRMAGPLDAHNLTSDAVKIEVETLPVPADPSRLVMGADMGAPACGLPPSSAFLYVYEGVSG